MEFGLLLCIELLNSVSQDLVAPRQANSHVCQLFFFFQTLILNLKTIGYSQLLEWLEAVSFLAGGGGVSGRDSEEGKREEREKGLRGGEVVNQQHVPSEMSSQDTRLLEQK